MKVGTLSPRIPIELAILLGTLLLGTACKDSAPETQAAPSPDEMDGQPTPLFPQGFWVTDDLTFDGDEPEFALRRQLRVHGSGDQLETQQLVGMQGQTLRSRTTYEIARHESEGGSGVLLLKVKKHEQPHRGGLNMITSMLGSTLELRARDQVISYRTASPDSVQVEGWNLGFGDGSLEHVGDEESAEARFHELAALLGTPGEAVRADDESPATELVSLGKLATQWELEALSPLGRAEIERARMQMLRGRDGQRLSWGESLSSAGFNPFIYAMATDHAGMGGGATMRQQMEEELARLVAGTPPATALADTAEGKALVGAVEASLAAKDPEPVLGRIENTRASQIDRDSLELTWRDLVAGGDGEKVTGVRLLGEESLTADTLWLSEGYEVDGRRYRPNLKTAGMLTVAIQYTEFLIVPPFHVPFLVGRTATGDLAFSQLVAEQEAGEGDDPDAGGIGNYPATVAELFGRLGRAVEDDDLGAILSLYDPRRADLSERDYAHAMWQRTLTEIKQLRQIAADFQDLYAREAAEEPVEENDNRRIVSRNGARPVYLELDDEEMAPAERLERSSWGLAERRYRPNLVPVAELSLAWQRSAEPVYLMDLVVGQRPDGSFALCYNALETDAERAARESASAAEGE